MTIALKLILQNIFFSKNRKKVQTFQELLRLAMTLSLLSGLLKYS